MQFGYFTLSDNHYDDNRRERQPVRRRHPRRGGLRRGGRAPFGVDRRASFQHARRAVLPRSGAGQCRGPHETHPPRAGGDRVAAAPSDPRRRAMGDARPACPAAASISPPAAAMTGASTCRSNVSFEDNQAIFEEGMEVVRRLWSSRPADLASRQALPVRRCRDHAQSRCSGRSRPMSPRSRSPRSNWPAGSAAA